MISTTTDILTRSWAITDEVIRLRLVAGDAVYPLPAAGPRSLTIGTAPTCAIQVQDPSNLISREHALLDRSDGRWWIMDQSKNGLYIDGQLSEGCALAPGHQIGLSRHVTLIAESAKTIALRAALARMIGWSAACAEAIDRALYMLRLAASGRVVFVLCGEPSLVPLAEELHRLALTEHRPFVLCDPRRTDEETERFTRCVRDGLTALAQARDGTVCIDDQRRPSDLLEMLDIWRRPGSTAQVMVLAKNLRKADVYATYPMEIPSLRTRRDELDRLIMEYEAEAVQRLGAGELALTPAQRAWISERSSATLVDVQRATLRLAAIRHAGSMTRAAALLEMSHASLGTWLQRRRCKPEILAAA